MGVFHPLHTPIDYEKAPSQLAHLPESAKWLRGRFICIGWTTPDSCILRNNIGNF